MASILYDLERTLIKHTRPISQYLEIKETQQNSIAL